MAVWCPQLRSLNAIFSPCECLRHDVFYGRRLPVHQHDPSRRKVIDLEIKPNSQRGLPRPPPISIRMVAASRMRSLVFRGVQSVSRLPTGHRGSLSLSKVWLLSAYRKRPWRSLLRSGIHFAIESSDPKPLRTAGSIAIWERDFPENAMLPIATPIVLRNCAASSSPSQPPQNRKLRWSTRKSTAVTWRKDRIIM